MTTMTNLFRGLTLWSFCLLACLAAACRSDVCDPGRSEECTCLGGRSGVQVCAPDGRSYSDCLCFSSPSRDAGPEDLIPVGDVNVRRDRPTDDVPDGPSRDDGTGDVGPNDGDDATDLPGDAGPGDGPGADDGATPPPEPLLQVVLSGTIGSGSACDHDWSNLSAFATRDGFQLIAQCEPGVAGNSGDLTQLELRVRPDGSYACELASYAPATCPAGSPSPCRAECGGEPPPPGTQLLGSATVEDGRARGSCTCSDGNLGGGFTASFDVTF